MAVFLLNPDLLRPTQLSDQQFGMGLDLDDLLSPLSIAPCTRHPLMRSSSYFRPWRVQNRDTGSTVHCDKDKFSVNLDVQQFAPEELKVTVVDNCVVIEGTHEEKQDKHGYISRQFKRRYVLPDGHDVGKIETKLSSDGVLTVTAPKIVVGERPEMVIPITHTGQPHKAAKAPEKKDEEK